jgi:hypothetical protein
VQEPELHKYKKQKNNDGAAGNEEVLPVLPEASAAPRNQIAALGDNARRWSGRPDNNNRIWQAGVYFCVYG